MKTLDFEKTIGEVEEKIDALRTLSQPEGIDIDAELTRLQAKLQKHLELAYTHLTAQDLMDLKIIDEIIPEPFGGAHRHKAEVIDAVGKAIEKHLQVYDKMDGNTIRMTRQQKFMTMTRLPLQ